MNGLILDSHVLLWWSEDAGSVSQPARVRIAAPDTPVFVSIVTPWELAIKESLGKLQVPGNTREALNSDQIDLLSIAPTHIDVIRTLPHHHRDPFDRMIIAQAIVEGLTVVTRDRRFPAYDIEVLPA